MPNDAWNAHIACRGYGDKKAAACGAQAVARDGVG